MKKILWILTERFSYSARSSIGRMFFQYRYTYVTDPPKLRSEFFGFTLEDTARPGNIKVYGETCVPGDLECDVSLFENDHYGKTIIFHTEPDRATIRFGSLRWIGCLAHGGNTHLDTSGCVLVASNYINRDRIQGSLKNELRTFVEKKIEEGYIVKARFVNLSQAQNVSLSINLKIKMMTQQFWKGLLMVIVGVVVAAFSTPPIEFSVLIVTIIGTILVYVGTNSVVALRPVSLSSTLTFKDVLHALLILIGNAIVSSVAMIVIDGKIEWLVMGKIVLSVAFTYLGSTLFAGPYTTNKVSWSRRARLEAQRVNNQYK